MKRVMYALFGPFGGAAILFASGTLWTMFWVWVVDNMGGWHSTDLLPNLIVIPWIGGLVLIGWLCTRGGDGGSGPYQGFNLP